jgi:predicted DNA-binding ribbon-helix-helix protein
MKLSVINEPIVIPGHSKKASFEDAFWDDLRQIGKDCDETLSQFDRQYGNLSSPSRLFVLGFLRRSRAH